MTLVEWMDRMGHMRGSPALWGSIERECRSHSHACGRIRINARFLDMRSKYLLNETDVPFRLDC